jgi:hypothetical protein
MPGPPGVGAAATKPKGGGSGLIIAVVLVLVLGGLGAGGYFLWRGGVLGAGAPTEPSPVCQKALKCCRTVMAKQAKDPKVVKDCDGMTKLSDAMCLTWEAKYRASGKLFGVDCP